MFEQDFIKLWIQLDPYSSLIKINKHLVIRIFRKFSVFVVKEFRHLNIYLREDLIQQSILIEKFYVMSFLCTESKLLWMNWLKEQMALAESVKISTLDK